MKEVFAEITKDPTIFFSMCSITLSGIAILVALYVPNKIAKNQNKITLFEKRLAPIMTLYKIDAFISSLVQIDTIYEGMGEISTWEQVKKSRINYIIEIWKASFDISEDYKRERAENEFFMMRTLTELQMKLCYFEFLFVNGRENYAQDLILQICEFVMEAIRLRNNGSRMSDETFEKLCGLQADIISEQPELRHYIESLTKQIDLKNIS